MSISRIFDISKRSLLSHQNAIDTTAKNIANINTEGYKRRRVDLTKLGFGFSGLRGSLNQEGITRIRHRFAENQVWHEKQNLGKYQTDEMILNHIEGIFGEPRDSGLANILSEFWNAWNNLANDPESQPARVLVRDNGSLLANTFNRLSSDLKNLQRQIALDIQEKVSQVNQLAKQIQTINKQLATGSFADLYDQRDVLITELSSLTNLDIMENQGGVVTISTNGQILVSGETLNDLTSEVTVTNGVISANVRMKAGNRPANITSGELGSLIEIQNQQIPEQMEKLNSLAVSIMNQVNSIHATGYNLDGVTGINFFKAGVTRADEIQVSDNILRDPSLIATSTSSNEPGDGSLAQAISDIQFDSVIEGYTISDFYSSLISQIGSRVRETQFLRGSQELVVQSLENQRDSVTAVSLDEEMTKLIEYERAYQAAARMITTADRMIQTVLDLI